MSTDASPHFPSFNAKGLADFRLRRLCGAGTSGGAAHPVQLLHCGREAFCPRCVELLVEHIERKVGWWPCHRTTWI